MDQLGGKVALVTGASRGIGRAIAQRLAGAGALVAVHYKSNRAAAEETTDAIRRAGGRALPVEADLAAPDAADTVYAALDAGLKEEGLEAGFDILVNNAALGPAVPLAQVTPEHLDELLAINARSPFFLVQQGLPRLRDNGRIINISSLASRTAFPEAIAYAMTKGALDAFTLALAKEVAPRGITVNAVAPGFVETDMNAPLRESEQGRQWLASQSVFNRIGQPADIADAVAFLASGEARWITGQWLSVSGGSAL
ncbi:SDR family oxidoreductase [Streptomyces sp. A7024]|uniref:SDR family oxidoreductase n=1 Tax=Streptomyces coryli TaxID=1128680 RepID=A0A6G4U185_9ACTN|nr:SDR family oxidoreductase [Streptomyces coryli]NGN65520.1 SDR family oxidoreductase [Streptomyces coryli]